MRIVLILVGCVATVLAIAGALLPGLPTTPFLLVALWAFARSSETLYSRLQSVPLLRTALAEAKRFEEKRAVHPNVKVTAVSVAWLSTAFTAIMTGATWLTMAVALAATAGTAFMLWIPTDRS
jgi:uncharacterized membrane protein YbaN (DUF454 family)